MTSYRYVFGSLRDEQVIEEISLYGVYMSMELNAGGTFTGTFNLDQTGKTNQDLLDASIPMRTFVAVERNDIPIWLGFVWSRTYQSQSKSAQIFAQSLEAYPNYQLIETNFLATADQRNVFRTLWTDMQGVAGRNLNVNVPPAFSTELTKSLDIKGYEYKTYGDAMSDLADAEDGFDWYIEIVKDGTVYKKTLQIGYPTLGALKGEATLVFEYPGTITNYYHTESGVNAGTNIFVLGAGEGSEMIVSKTSQQAMIDSGFPRWDKVVSRKDVSKKSILNSIANQEKKNRKPPMDVIQIEVKADRDPEFGSYRLGDAARTVIVDARHPSGLDSPNRLIKWELRPRASDSPDIATLTFQEDE